MGNLLKGLPVLRISSLADTILVWNRHDVNEVEVVFEYAFSYVHDDVFIFLFILESKEVHSDVRTYDATHDFALVKDWWGVNVLHSCYAINKSAKV